MERKEWDAKELIGIDYDDGTFIPFSAIDSLGIEEKEEYKLVKCKWLGFIPDEKYKYVKTGEWIFVVKTIGKRTVGVTFNTKELALKMRDEIIERMGFKKDVLVSVNKLIINRESK